MRCQNCYRETCETLTTDENAPIDTPEWDAHLEALMECEAAEYGLPRGWFCPMCGDGYKIAEGETCIYCGKVSLGEVPF